MKNLSGGIAYGHRRYMSAGLIGFFMHCSSPVDDGLGCFGYGASHDFAGYFQLFAQPQASFFKTFEFSQGTFADISERV